MLLFHLYCNTKPEHLTDARADPRKCIVLSPSNWPLRSLLTRESLDSSLASDTTHTLNQISTVI